MKQLRDLIKLLIDPHSIKSTCFMCFKPGDKMMNIFENIHIENQWFSIALSLKSVIKYLFPMQDIMLSQACLMCTDSLLHLYIHIRQKEYFENHLKKLIETVNNKLHGCDLKSNLFIDMETQLPAHKKGDHKIDGAYEDCVMEKSEMTETCKRLNKKNYKKRVRKLYNCDICDYTTKSKTTLEGHKNNKHFQQRPHLCSICSKRFYTKSALNEHRRTHNSLRKIICEICGDTFSHDKTLRDHLKLHTNDKTYECYVCNHRFVNQSRVNSHMKQKHGEKKELCMVCGKKFAFKKDVLRHLKLVHKTNENIKMQADQESILDYI